MVDLNRESDLTCVIVTHDIEEAVVMGEKILALTGSAKGNSRIIDNPCALKFTDRDADGAQAMCRDLRRLLESLL